MRTISKFSALVFVLFIFYALPVLAKGGATPPAATTQAPASAPAVNAAPQQSAGTSAPFESQVLAYQGADLIAQKIAIDVCTTLIPKGKQAGAAIVIYDQTTFANILAYEAFLQNAKAIAHSYSRLSKTVSATDFAADAAGSSTTSTSFSFTPVSDVTGVISMIAVSSNSETYAPITIADSVMATEITHYLQGTTCSADNIIYPPLFGQGSASSQAATDIQSTIDALNDAREAAHRKLATSIKGATTNYPAAALFDIDNLYDALMGSLFAANSTTGIAGSAPIVQGRALALIVNDPNSFVLLSTVLSAGGTALDHKTFWTNLTSGDDFSFSGGIIVGSALWQPAASNAPLYADVLRYRTDLVDAPVTPTPVGLALKPSVGK